MSAAERDRRRDHGRWLVREVLAGERWAKSQRPEIRARVGRANTERLLGWCPLERRDEYRRLRSMRFSATEARAIIEADLPAPQIAPAPKRGPRSFDEQLAAVAAGAALIAIRPLRRPDPDMTLGGVGSALL